MVVRLSGIYYLSSNLGLTTPATTAVLTTLLTTLTLLTLLYKENIRRSKTFKDRTTSARASRGLGDGVGDDGLGEVEVGAEEVDALISEEVVVVLPAELLSDETTALHALHQVHDLKVGDGKVSVLGHADVLLDDDDTL